MTMRILDRPHSLDELRALSRGGTRRVAGVIAVPWHELLRQDEGSFEMAACRRVTGSRYGLADLGVRVAGCLGDLILLEISGDVSMLLEDYEAMLAEEAREEGGEHAT